MIAVARSCILGALTVPGVLGRRVATPKGQSRENAAELNDPDDGLPTLVPLFREDQDEMLELAQDLALASGYMLKTDVASLLEETGVSEQAPAGQCRRRRCSPSLQDVGEPAPAPPAPQGGTCRRRRCSPGQQDVGEPEHHHRVRTCAWPGELNGTYHDHFVVGSGATGCVHLAYDSENRTVAVKVSKTGNLGAWKGECATMQGLRLSACRAGADSHRLAQMYLPTCTGVGGTAGVIAYYVMQAGGTQPIGGIREVGLNVEQQKMVFAQFIEAIWSMHGIGFSHNDLHQNNIVLSGTPPTELCLIDFGTLHSLRRASRRGYKRDGNAIWRWTTEIAGCDPSVGWRPHMSRDEARTARGGFLACLAENWGLTEPASVRALRVVLTADITEGDNQHVEGLYQSAFVQEHLAPPRADFPWDGATGCLTWSDQRWAEAELDVLRMRANFDGLTVYKCETVPSWDTVSLRTCRLSMDKPSCFSLTSGVSWACFPDETIRTDCTRSRDPSHTNYAGTCVKAEHINYDRALDWPR